MPRVACCCPSERPAGQRATSMVAEKQSPSRPGGRWIVSGGSRETRRQRWTLERDREERLSLCSVLLFFDLVTPHKVFNRLWNFIIKLTEKSQEPIARLAVSTHTRAHARSAISGPQVETAPDSTGQHEYDLSILMTPATTTKTQQPLAAAAVVYFCQMSVCLSLSSLRSNRQPGFSWRPK